MAKIKSVSNYNGASWDTPIPLGADDVNIDITSATTDPTTDTTATAAGLIAADVVAGEGDTDATAWTKFNKFRRRVYNAFNGVAGIAVVNSAVSSGSNSKVYSAGYINNYMTNVVGHSGIVTPTNGTIMDQLNTTNQNLNNRVAKSGDTMTGDLNIENRNMKIVSTEITNNVAPEENYYGRGMYLYDVNNVELGAVRPFTGSSGTIANVQGAQITASRTINGTKMDNYIRLGINSSGDPIIRIPAASAAEWRNGIGLGTNGELPITVDQGGTGKATHTSNSVLAGNGTSAVKNIATANGALFATSANGAASFGTLPIAQGGTGATARIDGQANFGFYTSVDQLGLTSSATMASIAAAMPNSSIAVLNANDFDVTTGIVTPDNATISLVTIYKINSNRIFAIGARSYANIVTANARLYYAAWNGAAFIGWRKVLLADSTALAIGDGGTGQTGIITNNTINDIIPTKESGISITSATYKQWGKIAQINITVKKTAAVTTAGNISIGALANALKPSVSSMLICSSSTITHGWIGTDGSLVVNGTWTANTEKTIMSTYILA